MLKGMVAFLAFLATLGVGCFSPQSVPPRSSDSSAAMSKIQTDLETQTKNACGDPTRFPVSKDCVRIMGYPDGLLLQQKSDLMMDVWRYCPSFDPCIGVREATPACKSVEMLPRNTSEFKKTQSECFEAQKGDYSCGALQKDPEFQRLWNDGFRSWVYDPDCLGPTKKDLPGSKNWNLAKKRQLECEDRHLPHDSSPQCTKAQAALSDFSNRVKQAMLEAQLRDVFVPPPSIVYSPPALPPPIGIQQRSTAPPPMMPLPPVPSGQVFTNCTNLGFTTNCITR